MDEIRRAGLAKMNEVYAWEMPNIEGDPYFDLTVDHLFGAIWSRPGLSMRDKRLMTLSVVTALGLQDLTEVQVNAAMENEELTEDEAIEVMHMTRAAVRTIKKVSNPAALNVGINLGRAAGGSLADHFHQHVVPRWQGDANFITVTAGTKVLPQLLAETRQLLADGWH